jgi:hypothetical protein
MSSGFESKLIDDYLKAVRLEEDFCQQEYQEHCIELSTGNGQGQRTRWDEGNATTRLDPRKVAQQAVECILESFKLVTAMRDELHRVNRLLAQILPRHFSVSSLAEPRDPAEEVRSVYSMGTRALRSLREGAVFMSRTLNTAVPSKPAVEALHGILRLMNEEAQKSIDVVRCRSDPPSEGEAPLGRDGGSSSSTALLPSNGVYLNRHDAVCVLEWKASSLPPNSPRYPDPHSRGSDGAVGSTGVGKHFVPASGRGNVVLHTGPAVRAECIEEVVDQTRHLITCLQTKASATSPRKQQPQPKVSATALSTPRRMDSARAARATLQQLRKVSEDNDPPGAW